MKRWIGWAAALYPRTWRERYAAEFEELLTDVEPGWRVLADVVWGALRMQVARGSLYWKFAATMAAAGALLSTVASFAVPHRYESSTVVRVYRPYGITRAARRLEQLKGELLSRHVLVEILLDPALNLYPAERRTLPIEEVAALMQREIRIQPVSDRDSLPPFAARISYSCGDPKKAQEVVRRLAQQAVRSNAGLNASEATVWRAAWDSDLPPRAEQVFVQESAGRGQLVSPSRLTFLSVGLTGGLLLGFLVGWANRHRAAGLRLSAFAVAGALLACGASFLIPKRYTATAVLRSTEPVVPARFASLMPDDALYAISREIAGQIGTPGLTMQTVETEFGSGSAVALSVTRSNPYKAQAVVSELVSRIYRAQIERGRGMASKARTAEESEAIAKAYDYHLGAELALIEASNMPRRPDAPGWPIVSAAGLAIGLMAGAADALRRRPRPSHS